MNFAEMFNLLAEAGAWKTSDYLSIPATALSFIGAIFYFSSFLPTFYETYRTRNTVGINPRMFLIQLCCTSLFCLGAIIMTVQGFMLSKQNTIMNGFLFSFMNATTGFCSFYIFFVKKQNMKEAAEMGISESEHYEKVCVPAMEARYGVKK